MDNVKWYKKPEMVVAFSALLISFVTAIVSMYSAYVDRAYARASVWPRLEIHRNLNTTHFEYSVTNSGNGPAVIKYGIVQYKTEPIKFWNDIPNLPSITQSHISNRILSPQNTVKPLSYTGKELDKFDEADKFIGIELCYCSIYEECWLIDKLNEPKSVNGCLVDKTIAFSQ
ncbi:hypothetical protein [Microbulbifer sp. PSTR4-B]|uniref:hypothetical protein n=1 Tax=unclassified Microbulbifer TaxID=2619833 RepID=UPI00403A9083